MGFPCNSSMLRALLILRLISHSVKDQVQD